MRRPVQIEHILPAEFSAESSVYYNLTLRVAKTGSSQTVHCD